MKLFVPMRVIDIQWSFYHQPSVYKSIPDGFSKFKSKFDLRPYFFNFS